LKEKEEKAASSSLQVEMSNRSSTQKENAVTSYDLELDHLKKKVSMMVQLKSLDPNLAVAYEELLQDVLLLLEWDMQRALKRQEELSRWEELKRKEQLRRQDVLKKCFERKEAQCVQPTNKILYGLHQDGPQS